MEAELWASLGARRVNVDAVLGVCDRLLEILPGETRCVYLIIYMYMRMCMCIHIDIYISSH